MTHTWKKTTWTNKRQAKCRTFKDFNEALRKKPETDSEDLENDFLCLVKQTFFASIWCASWPSGHIC